MTKKEQRAIVVQFTSPELRARVRHQSGLGLLTAPQARSWRCMAYGVLREREREHHDGRAARTRADINAALALTYGS